MPRKKTQVGSDRGKLLLHLARNNLTWNILQDTSSCSTTLQFLQNRHQKQECLTDSEKYCNSTEAVLEPTVALPEETAAPSELIEPAVYLPEETAALSEPALPTVDLPEETAAPSELIKPVVYLPEETSALLEPAVPDVALPEETAALLEPAVPDVDLPEETAALLEPAVPDVDVPEETAALLEPAVPDVDLPEETAALLEPAVPDVDVPEETAALLEPAVPDVDLPEETAALLEPAVPDVDVPEETAALLEPAVPDVDLSEETAALLEPAEPAVDLPQDVFDSDDSVEDPDYRLPQHDTSISESEGEVINDNKKRKVLRPTELQQKGRKRVKHEEKWLKNEAKILKNFGKSYNSFAKEKRVIPPKIMGVPCGEKCRLKCSTKIDEEKRRKIFEVFWGLGNVERQRSFISSCMTAINPKYRYQKENSHRICNNAFSFEIEGNNRVRVCKTFFKNTLAITDRPIRTVLEKKINFEDKRGKHGLHKTVPDGVKVSIRCHIDKIPRIESHYCRADSKKQYIEGGKTIKDLHRDYVRECSEKGMTPGNYVMYARIFNEEFNMSFFTPKKDQCELCVAYETATPEEKAAIQESYEVHLLEKDLSRLEKENDKKSNSEVAVYDLQAVLPCPIGQTSPFYYVSKLGVYNFTIYNLKQKGVSCYVWHEGEAHRGATEIGSCVFKYLQNLNEKTEATDVIFYSDNCPGQQKNQYLVNLYAYAVRNLEQIKSIEHKFLITGHTQNEGDSVHAVIERQISRARKAGPIFSPEQYYAHIRTAKKSGAPYIVHEMSHKDFYDLKELASEQGIKMKVSLKNMKVIRLEKDKPGIMSYKTSFGQHYFEEMNIEPRRKSLGRPTTLKPAYQKKVGITDKKKKGLLSLISKKCVPVTYSGFYNNL